MTESFAEEFAQMALSLHDEPTVEETVERVLDYALKAVTSDYAGVVFVHAGSQLETIASTHSLVADLDKFQAECGQGPDLDVLSDRLSILVSDAQLDRRWPVWGAGVADLGVRSVLCTRIYTSSSTIGMLNLYAAQPGCFDVDDQAVAHILARHAAVALASARDIESLWSAIDARKLIGQAQGILMERYDLDADRAFGVLLRYSQNHNVKLRVVAQRLVDTRKLPG